MIKKILIFLAVAVVFYAGVCFAVYRMQEKMIFPGTKLPENFQFDLSSKVKEVNIPVAGANINGLEFFPDSAAKGVVLFFHGNGGTLEGWSRIAPEFTKRGYTLLMVDYRGYGKSTGHITSQDQLFEDAQTIYDFTKKEFAGSKIIVWGRSIGTGIAAELTSTNTGIDKLVLETPYYSLEEVAQQRASFLPVKQILKYPLPTYIFVKHVACPIYILHGTADQVIPYTQAEKLSKLVKCDFETVPGGTHELDKTDGHKRFMEAVLQ